MNFQKLAPRSKILVALAYLKLENTDTYEFSQVDITNRITKEMPGFSAGRKKVISDKLKEMRENNTVTVLDQRGDPIGDIKVLSCSPHLPFLYCIGPDTVETPMSATLLKRLQEGQKYGTRTVPIDRENEIVDEVYELFSNDAKYALASTQDIEKKISDAVTALYFTRTTDGLLEPTHRLLRDDYQFISFLAIPPESPKEAQ